MNDNDALKEAFQHGYVAACSNLVHLHDEPGMAADVFRELGIGQVELDGMDLCEYDQEAFAKISRERASGLEPDVCAKTKRPRPCRGR